jgi:hypothetical protein
VQAKEATEGVGVGYLRGGVLRFVPQEYNGGLGLKKRLGDLCDRVDLRRVKVKGQGRLSARTCRLGHKDDITYVCPNDTERLVRQRPSMACAWRCG